MPRLSLNLFLNSHVFRGMDLGMNMGGFDPDAVQVAPLEALGSTRAISRTI